MKKTPLITVSLIHLMLTTAQTLISLLPRSKKDIYYSQEHLLAYATWKRPFENTHSSSTCPLLFSDLNIHLTTTGIIFSGSPPMPTPFIPFRLFMQWWVLLKNPITVRACFQYSRNPPPPFLLSQSAAPNDSHNSIRSIFRMNRPMATVFICVSTTHLMLTTPSLSILAPCQVQQNNIPHHRMVTTESFERVGQWQPRFTRSSNVEHTVNFNNSSLSIPHKNIAHIHPVHLPCKLNN